ncbi:hypothetical protein [Parasphingorhabdus sp.]|uniref:hypothetical protein n=1 Tax=Parasphingorhabdus sp. TaxID=2709688 RepID=UPI0035945CE9
MNNNSSLHHKTTAYPVSGLGHETHSQSANDRQLNEPVHRKPTAFAEMSPNEIKAELNRFWELIDDRHGL